MELEHEAGSNFSADYARARIAALEAERDAARKSARNQKTKAQHARRAQQTMGARIEHIEAALREYGDHTQTCDWRAPSAYPFACSCGWESTRRALTTSTQEDAAALDPTEARGFAEGEATGSGGTLTLQEPRCKRCSQSKSKPGAFGPRHDPWSVLCYHEED